MNPAPLDSDAPQDHPIDPTGKTKTWKIGSLSYTKSALISLFLILLLGDFFWSMRDRSVGPVASWYLKHLEIPNLVFALILSSFPAALHLFLSPVVSYKSDRLRSKWGRRIPFLLVTTPIAAFGIIGMGLCPYLGPLLHQFLGASSPGEKIATVICFGLFWAAFELATVAAQAVFGGLINDVVPKELLGRFYGLFRAVSLIDGMIFNTWIIGKVDSWYTGIFCVVGLLYGVGFLWVCYKIKEGDYPPPPPADPTKIHPVDSLVHATKIYFRECFTSSHYIWIFVMMTLAALCFQPINIFNIPYAKSMGMDMEYYGKCLAFSFFISLCLSYFLGWLADVFHPIRTGIVSLLAYAAICIWGSIYATNPKMYAIALVLHVVVSGCYFTTAATLGQRLFPHSKFAQFASAGGVLLSIGTMITGPALGSLIDATGNNYRYAYVIGGLLALIAAGAGFHVNSRFMKLGGPKHYHAPE